MQEFTYFQLQRYGFPAETTKAANVKHTLSTNDDEKYSYVGRYPANVRFEQEFLDTKWVDHQIINNVIVDERAMRPDYAGISQEYMSTPIEGKDVYVPVFGCGYYLFTGTQHPYIVVNKGEKVNIPGVKYAKVIFNNEKILSDLYKHSWWYSYDYHTDSFLELPEKGKIANLTRYLLQVDILRIAGTSEDRLADYGRVIAFLLSKLNLTPEEQVILGPFIDQVPDIGTLASICDKEAEIRRLVALAHNNPEQYLKDRYNTSLSGEDVNS